MGLFTPGRHSAFQKKLTRSARTRSARTSSDEEHPAFALGQRARHWLDSQFERAGRFLNTWQHRAGFRRRNYVVLGTLFTLLAYFIYELLTVL